MNEAINAAATRWRQGYPKYCTGNSAPGNPWLTSQEELKDASALASAWVEDHAAREAIASERRLPIDDRWLRSIGFTRQGDWLEINSQYLKVQYDYRKIWLHQEGDIAELRECQSRGQLLDLLSAVNIPIKTQ